MDEVSSNVANCARDEGHLGLEVQGLAKPEDEEDD
jgi:hypothetical protein